jgi:hypothetical protein
MTNDPLLPGQILPSDYLEQQARGGDAGSAPRRQPATTHVQPRVTPDKLLLHMQ